MGKDRKKRNIERENVCVAVKTENECQVLRSERSARDRERERDVEDRKESSQKRHKRKGFVEWIPQK